MRVGILIENKNLNNYENTKFRQVALKENISLKMLDIKKISISIEQNKQVIYYDGEVLNNIDYLIPRTGSATTLKYSNIINAFVSSGIEVLNDGDVILTMLDKYRTLSILGNNNIPITDSLLVSSRSDIDLAEKLYGYPMIKKSNTGSLGYGIYLVENRKQLEDLYNHSKLLDSKYYFFLERFYDYKIGEDIRVIMLDGKVLGAMRRISDGSDFKSNYYIHKNAIKVEVTNDIENICKSVVEVLGAKIAGIDLLETKDGYVVCEVNSAPGFEGMEEANPGINIAKSILKRKLT